MHIRDLEGKLAEGLKDPRRCNDMFHATHSVLGDERSSATIGASEGEAFRLNTLAAYNKMYSAFGFIGKALDEIEKAKVEPKGEHAYRADMHFASAMNEFVIAENCAAKAGFEDISYRIHEAACIMIPPFMKGEQILAIFDRIDSTLRKEGSMITELTRLDVLIDQADEIYKGIRLTPGFGIGLREASKKCWLKRRQLGSAFYDMLEALLEQGNERADKIGAIYSGLMKEKAHLEEQDDTKIPEYTYIDQVKGKIKILHVETLKRYVQGIIEEDIRQQSEERGSRTQSLDALYIVGMMHEVRTNNATAYMIYSKFLRKYTGDPAKAREVEDKVDAILESDYKLRKIVEDMKRPEQTEFQSMEREKPKITPLQRQYFQEKDNDRNIGNGVIPYDVALIVRRLLDQDDIEGINMISQEIGDLERTNEAAKIRRAQRSLNNRSRPLPYEIRIIERPVENEGQYQLRFRSWITPFIESASQMYFNFKEKPEFTVYHDKKGQMVVNFAA